MTEIQITKFTLILLVIMIIPLQKTLAQSDTVETMVDEIFQELAEESDEEIDKSGLIDRLEDLAENPVNINQATLKELLNIPGMDILTAGKIISYRNNSGRVFSLKELDSITGININKLNRLKVFLMIGNNFGNKNSRTDSFSLQFRNRIAANLKKEDGFIRNKFEGNNLKTYNRLKANYNNYRLGITIDKDPGEKSINDFYSLHLSINNLGIFNKVIIGDFLSEFGQGLALWSPYSFSKSAEAIYAVKKKSIGVYEYTSTDENKFFRGIAANLKLKDFWFSLFYSNHNIDANVDTTAGYIQSTPISGYHRTSTELMEKSSANEITLGGMINASFSENINLAFLLYHSKYSSSFIPHSIFDLRGNKFSFYSISYNFFYKNINLYGEVSFNGTSLASISCFQITVTDYLAFVTSIRSYPGNYYNIHSFGFGEQNNTQNEFGIYNGIRFNTPVGLFNLYYDQFKFPYKSYYSPLPASGDEFLFNYTTSPLKGLTTNIKYKFEDKDFSTKVGETIQIHKREKSSFRMELKYILNKTIELKGRIEISNYNISNLDISEKGFMIFQDIKFMPSGIFYIDGRIIFFKTDSYNSAIYEFENDLTGTYSITGLNGQGIRWYCLMKYKLFETLKLSLKYSEIYKPADKSLGSGYSEITGNFDNQIGLQIEFNL
jgi:Helix-hairpin-helix motif